MTRVWAIASAVLSLIAGGLVCPGPASAASPAPIIARFTGDTTGARANGFSSSAVPQLFFFDTTGADLSVGDFASQTHGKGLLIGPDDSSALEIRLSAPTNAISLAFGNDDPNYVDSTAKARLTLFRDATPVGQVDVLVNADDSMDQSIRAAGEALFNRATFQYVDAAGAPANLAEIVDDIRVNTLCTIAGTPGNDNLVGTAGHDVICGDSGNDTINADAGNDLIYGGSGADTISGGNGGDTIFGGSANDRISGGSGADTIDGATGNDQVSAGSGNDVVLGDDGNDTLSGDAGADQVSGGAGNDRVFGVTGADQLSGGTGNDLLSGGSSADQLFGDSGNDLLSGGTGNDLLSGSTGSDLLSGSTGNDLLSGGSGRDRLSAGTGTDRLSGGTARDHCDGGKGHDSASSCEVGTHLP